MSTAQTTTTRAAASEPAPRGEPAQRGEPVTGLIDVLAARCQAALLEIEARGGPDVATHLEVLRRALGRGGRRDRRDRDRVRRALAAIADGRGPTPQRGPRAEDRRLVADLRRLERVLTRSARIGSAGRRIAATPPGFMPAAIHRAGG